MPDSVRDVVAWFISEHHVQRTFEKRKRTERPQQASAPVGTEHDARRAALAGTIERTLGSNRAETGAPLILLGHESAAVGSMPAQAAARAGL
jgi:hypothetical protein